MNWATGWDVEYGDFSVFGVYAWRGGGAKQDVTYFRGVPTQIGNLMYADPFGDATATLTFPKITGHDSFSSIPWMREFTQIDIYRYPCTAEAWYEGEQTVLNPLTNQRNLYLHTRAKPTAEKPLGDLIQPMWEGFITTINPTPVGTQVTCQGALYQLDYYYAKPLMPSRPRTVESQIWRYFNPAYRGLYTKELKIDWPEGWTRAYTDEEYQKALDLSGGDINGRYMPIDLMASGSGANYLLVGQRITGYLTRATGKWDKILTGYVNDQLSYMYASPTSGDTLMRGDQWTITKDPGRQPRMWLRRQSREHTCEVWYGQQGVEASLTRDGTQVTNMFFADGKGANQGGDTAWNLWRQPNSKASWCIWQPIAATPADETPPHQSGNDWYDVAGSTSNGYGLYHYFDPYWGEQTPDIVGKVWPLRKGSDDVVDVVTLPDAYDAEYERYYGIWVSEKQVTFPDGIDESTAREIAYNWIKQDQEAGWSGSITLKADPYTPAGDIMSKWDIRAGDIIVLKGFQGQNGSTIGVNKFHITQVNAEPMANTVTLSVDSKFRDLLTVEEALAHGRDTLSPVRSLQVGKRSGLINDMIVPWNVRQGSGYFPRMASSYELRDSFPHSFDYPLGTYPNKKGGLQQAGNRPIDIFQDDYLPGGSGKTIGTTGGDDSNLLNPGGPTKYKGKVLRTTPTRKEALYVPVNAGSTDAVDRWAIYPILLSQAGNIMRSEFAVYDQYGNLAQVEFHVSIYLRGTGITTHDMPYQGAQSPLTSPKAFQEYDPDTGYYINQDGEYTMPTEKPRVGWGSYDMPAGYSPKTKISSLPGLTAGNMPTGMLVDGAPWDYSFFGQQNFPTFDPGAEIHGVDVSCTCVVYIEYQSNPDYDWLYVRGRLYRGLGSDA